MDNCSASANTSTLLAARLNESAIGNGIRLYRSISFLFSTANAVVISVTGSTTSISCSRAIRTSVSTNPRLFCTGSG